MRDVIGCEDVCGDRSCKMNNKKVLLFSVE